MFFRKIIKLLTSLIHNGQKKEAIMKERKGRKCTVEKQSESYRNSTSTIL